MDRMFELMDEPHEIQDKKGAHELTRARGDIAFDHVSFKYDPDGSEILHDVNFTVKAGETVAFVGMSGGGKSTIVNLIPRFYEVSEGAVRIDGHDVRDVTVKSLREQIGLVLQDTILFSDTIRENILMGQPNATEEQMIAAAKAANAHDFIVSLPQGYDTTVGERGVKLSGGQKQRVAIARVFLKNPAILVLDEATSALDLESESLIQESVEKLAADRTTIMIAHRLSTITHADRIIVISHGKVIEQGTHQQLLRQQSAYYDLYKIQNLTI
ncbi:Putative multidrug export ATP-binding/permease protein [Metalysinibacillus saudimassiliensis]|uniref:Putative multidrug export ATP-binding/permease protein n=1 Tax=Metalysinibacillus saudimassiliensis TaxID=1461583 RepID=A0A078MF20_9BACL|nr:Putative multidrug export ATP-binding/permease protein [Metalysinibacillus saudimassiliensis]